MDDEMIKREIWLGGIVIPGTDSDEICMDDSSYWIRYNQFQTDDKLAWDYERRMRGPSRQ